MNCGFTDIGDKLDQMRERRVDADYHMLSDVSISECQNFYSSTRINDNVDLTFAIFLS